MAWNHFWCYFAIFSIKVSRGHLLEWGHLLELIYGRYSPTDCKYIHDKTLSNEEVWEEPQTTSDMSHVMRKPVLGVCDQLTLKLACSAAEASWGLEISAIASRGIKLSRQRTTKALIRLCECSSAARGAAWSGSTLFAIPSALFGLITLR